MGGWDCVFMGGCFVRLSPVIMALASRCTTLIYYDENTDDTDQTDLHGYEIRAQITSYEKSNFFIQYL